MKKQEFKKNEERLRNLQDSFKCSNIWIVGVPGGEKEEQEIENLFEWIMKENFPNLAKEIDLQEVQEAQRVPEKLDSRRNTPTHIIITLPKIKNKKNLKRSKRKGESYLQRSAHKTVSWFLKRDLKARRGWQEVVQVMKGKDLHPRLLYPAKLSFRMEGQIKCFSDKVKLKEFIITKSLLYEMLKGFI